MNLWVDGDSQYFAGLFDGEGTVILAKPYLRHRHQAPLGSVTLKVQIANTVRAPLDELVEKLGGSIRKYQPQNLRCKVSYRWLSCGKLSARFLALVLPHLRIKKRQVEAALLFAETWGSEWKHMHIQGRPLTEEGLQLRRLAFLAYREDMLENGGGEPLSWSIERAV